MAQPLGVDKPLMSFPTWFFDYDNDGWLDLFVASFVPSVTEVVRGVIGLPPQAETMKLYRNDGRGGFDDVTAATGLTRVVPAMGANFGDIDNDGFLDMYLGTGAPSYAALVPNVMFRNHGGRRFASTSRRPAAPATCRRATASRSATSTATATTTCWLTWAGSCPATRTGRRSSGIRAAGTARSVCVWSAARATAPPSALGSLHSYRQPDGTLAERHRVVTSGGSFGASAYLQRIGLGPAASVERLDVLWPASGLRQSFAAIAAGQTIEIRENVAAYRRLDGPASSGAIR